MVIMIIIIKPSLDDYHHSIHLRMVIVNDGLCGVEVNVLMFATWSLCLSHASMQPPFLKNIAATGLVTHAYLHTCTCDGPWNLQQ